jgi:hypothetical protein
MTEAEAAERRELVRLFHTHIRTAYLAVEKRMKEETDNGWPKRYLSFGVWDDNEENRFNLEQAKLCASLQMERSMLDRMWRLVKEIFGKDLVDHALDEGKGKIGDLPFID